MALTPARICTPMSCFHAPRPEEIVRDVTVFFATTLYFTTQSSNRPRNLSYELPDGTSSLSAPNVSTPLKSIQFPRLRGFSLSCSKRHYQVQEQSAAWYAACGSAFSNKPSLQTLGSVLRISYLTPCVTLSWLGVVGLKRTSVQKLSSGLFLTFKRNPAPCLVRQWIRVLASVPRWIWYLV